MPTHITVAQAKQTVVESPSKHSILRLSKSIREEAFLWLYKNSTFKFGLTMSKYDRQLQQWKRGWDLSRMMHVDIELVFAPQKKKDGLYVLTLLKECAKILFRLS